MLPLQTRFKKVFTLEKGNKQSFLNGTLILNSDRALVYETERCAACGIDDDVFAFAFDENNVIWYMKYTDIIGGNKTVYRFSINDLYVKNKGIIDSNGGFIFKEDDTIYRENRIGEKRIVGDMKSFKDFFAVESGMKYLTAEKIDSAVELSMEKKKYTREDILEKLLQLHSTINILRFQIDNSSNLNAFAAELIFDIFELCKYCEAGSCDTLISQLREQLKKRTV